MYCPEIENAWEKAFLENKSIIKLTLKDFINSS